MKVFDVSLNGRKLCRAGVGADGVLTAIVTWARLTGPAAAEARRLRRPLEDTFLQVGGLKDDSHRRWSYRNLRAGDRVTVEVAEARRFDPPVDEKRTDSALDEQREKAYYLRLKRKFEGQRTTSARQKPSSQDAETTLLNVDLDIWSRSPLDGLVSAFGRRVFVLHAGKEGRRHSAHLELARSGQSRGADQLIRDFVALIRRLPPKGRAWWNRAHRRDFNVGIQAATKPHSYELPLDPATVRAAAAVNARIVITVYGADPNAESPRRAASRRPR
jgi:hypothetical protein